MNECRPAESSEAVLEAIVESVKAGRPVLVEH
jgi:hypothetical protein